MLPLKWLFAYLLCCLSSSLSENLRHPSDICRNRQEFNSLWCFVDVGGCLDKHSCGTWIAIEYNNHNALTFYVYMAPAEKVLLEAQDQSIEFFWKTSHDRTLKMNGVYKVGPMRFRIIPADIRVFAASSKLLASWTLLISNGSSSNSYVNYTATLGNVSGLITLPDISLSSVHCQSKSVVCIEQTAECSFNRTCPVFAILSKRSKIYAYCKIFDLPMANSKVALEVLPNNGHKFTFVCHGGNLSVFWESKEALISIPLKQLRLSGFLVQESYSKRSCSWRQKYAFSLNVEGHNVSFNIERKGNVTVTLKAGDELTLESRSRPVYKRDLESVETSKNSIGPNRYQWWKILLLAIPVALLGCLLLQVLPRKKSSTKDNDNASKGSSRSSSVAGSDTSASSSNSQNQSSLVRKSKTSDSKQTQQEQNKTGRSKAKSRKDGGRVQSPRRSRSKTKRPRSVKRSRSRSLATKSTSMTPSQVASKVEEDDDATLSLHASRVSKHSTEDASDRGGSPRRASSRLEPQSRRSTIGTKSTIMSRSSQNRRQPSEEEEELEIRPFKTMPMPMKSRVPVSTSSSESSGVADLNLSRKKRKRKKKTM